MTERLAVRAAIFWIALAGCELGDQFLPAPIVDHLAYLVATWFCLLATLVWWFVADARALGITPSWGLRFGVVFLPTFAIPYYRFRYTGLARGFRFLGTIFLLVVVWTMALLFVTGELW